LYFSCPIYYIIMRLISYQTAEGPRVAGVRENSYVDLHRADPRLPACMKKLLAQGPEGLRRAEAALALGEPIPAAELKPLPAVPRPEKIICVGLNYADHARETHVQPPPEPVLFNKFPSAISADGLPIVLPRLSQEVDYEAELVVVVGRGGRNISRQDALTHVAGYCCGNDVSARDWQLRKPGGQWLLGKSFDTFAPIGPAICTADEIPDPNHLAVQLRLNGRVMQQSNTDQLIFPIDYLVSYASGVCTLSPGDLIFTGTPSGVGFTRKPPIFLKPGDVVEVEIEKLGALRNTVVAETVY
jgi:2-keto-4-pentenoate hydratase/2-oxohepta-3-ene-1,7-dioic acid hydratase in catechol pathway